MKEKVCLDKTVEKSQSKGNAVPRGVDKFKLLSQTPEEEAQYDLVKERKLEKPSGTFSSIAQMVKGALGAGILSSHVGYMFAGCWVGIAFQILFGLYMTYCLYILVTSAHTLHRRTRVPSMTYSDVGEAAMICTENPTLIRLSRPFRFCIDFSLCFDMLGSCCAYQIIVARGIKQLVENTQQTSVYPLIEGYPNLRMYLAMLIIPFIGIVMIRHLQWLAPLSLVGNFVVVLCIGATIYYALEYNPGFDDLIGATDFVGFFKFAGISVFSMSCAGVAVAVENNMKEPDKFPRALFIGMAIIISATTLTSFFGYAAFLSECESPITLNFPMELFPKILKFAILLMLYVTHALTFWVPFNIIFYYIKPKLNPDKVLMWEFIFRGTLCFMLSLVAIMIPTIAPLISLIGCIALVNIAFIWPNIIELLVKWRNPGFGRFKWRLWKCVILLSIGMFLFAAGTYVNLSSLIGVAQSVRTTHIIEVWH